MGMTTGSIKAGISMAGNASAKLSGISLSSTKDMTFSLMEAPAKKAESKRVAFHYPAPGKV
jgi:hypothetical protein